MSNLVPASAIDDLFRQRQLTRDIVKLWFPTVVWGDGKIPIKKITEATGKAVDPLAWATPGTLQSKLNLLGQLTPSTLDIDLDVRLTADPHSRPRAWTEGEKALAEEWFYRPFREELLTLTGDTRNHWGRASVGGTGHWLIKLQPDDDLSRDEIRGRLKQLQFSASMGPFTIKLEVRFPTKAAAPQLYTVLPGSQYSDGDYVSFFNTPGRPDPHLLEIALQPLCQALYSAALRMVVAPHTGEGERHSTALLVSGVLRREVEDMEREGGRGFNRDDARRLFEEIFLHDTELPQRRKIFEADFAKDDASDLPGYTALGKRVGEDTAQALSCMLHGYDRGPIDRLRERLVFIHDQDVGVVDLGEMAGGANLAIYPRSAIALIHNETIAQKRGKRVFAFRVLENMKSRRHADGWIAAPGIEQGGFLYQGFSGQLLPSRQSDRERSLLNTAPGWLTPYDEEAPDVGGALDAMLGWFTANPHHRAKILQALAFKVQNPLVKAQFALAVVGGQGIGKSFFFYDVMRAVLGKSVTMSNIEAVYRGQYVFSPAVGASLLIIEEADVIPDFTLAKQLHRASQPDVNLKYASKGPQWCLGIPVYLTNQSNPRLQEEGAPDRTLYVIEAPTQTSMRLTAEEWLAFRERRAQEVMAIAQRLEDPEFLLGLRKILQEYPVTYSELHDNSKSDSLTEEYRSNDMSADQLAFQAMLARGYVHPAHPDWAFDAPISREMFNDGYNMLYRYFAGRGEKIKSNQYISQQLVKMLGELGVMKDYRKFKEGRVYWFSGKLGTLRQRFATIAGAPVPDESPAEEGLNNHSPEDCSRAWAYWKKAGLTDRTDY